ncbi:MAG TPA: transposase [Bryobacteraceae bacterium]|nr:transposase [Bryobacteraceae bacterium]
MARFARLVVPGFPHHITQRGNHRQDVFFSDNDRRMYLAILRDHVHRQNVRILAWCLMTNHVHIVAVPSRDDSFALAFGRTHNEYARWLHVRQRRVGHLWQNRFHSCPLEGRHLWEAVRYTELNPVRAGVVCAARDWRWSSAQAHLGGGDEWNLVDLIPWRERWTSETWRQALEAASGDSAFAVRLREATQTGRPCGESEFTKMLEAETGRSLKPQKRGPKPKTTVESGQMSFGIA